MNDKLKLVVLILCVLGGVAFFWVLVGDNTLALFDSKGWVAQGERNLAITAVFLMLIVVVPALALGFTFAWKYRAGRSQAKYDPNAENKTVAALIWIIPIAVISTLAVVTWRGTHALDPMKSIATGEAEELTIQVVALRWKWLFIYPEQNIATVNFVQFPERTPVRFELTADAPMSSFWVPQLGGQIYAMEGMSTQLNLMANEVGEFKGSSAEISGRGFAGMKFIAKSTSQADFEAWVQSVKQSPRTLDFDAYTALAEPSENNQQAFYSSADEDLYSSIIMKFIAPAQKMRDTEH